MTIDLYTEIEYDAKTIAKYILGTCIEDQKPISNLQLQKILFFCQKDYMQKTGEYLFFDDFEAWQYGPVIPSVYRQYSLWGGTKITWTSETSVTLPPKITNILIPVIQKYRDYEPWMLVEKTHVKGSSWYITYCDGAGDGKIIPKELIANDLIG